MADSPEIGFMPPNGDPVPVLKPLDVRDFGAVGDNGTAMSATELIHRRAQSAVQHWLEWLGRPPDQAEITMFLAGQITEARNDYMPPPAAPRPSFTTQMVPTMVYERLKDVVSAVSQGIVEGAYSWHAAVMVHPNDWKQLTQYLRDQGKYSDSNGPLGSFEINGITVLQDLGYKVPHLELRAE